MKQMRLSITPPSPATIPVHEVVQSDDALGDAVLLSGGIDPANPTELFSIEGTQADVATALSAQSGIRSVDVLSATAGTTYVYVREATDERSIAGALTADSLVVTLPIRFRSDGPVEITVLGAGNDLRSAVETVRTLAEVTVHSVRDGWSSNGGDALTDRQREVLRAARDRGYYDSPRECTQREIARDLGLDDSTVAEHLRKAEAALVERAIGRQ